MMLAKYNGKKFFCKYDHVWVRGVQYVQSLIKPAGGGGIMAGDKESPFAVWEWQNQFDRHSDACLCGWLWLWCYADVDVDVDGDVDVDVDADR